MKMALHMPIGHVKVLKYNNAMKCLPLRILLGQHVMLGIPKPLIVSFSVNGLKRSKRDHVFIPIKVAELQAQAQQAKAAGASLFSFSVRDGRGAATLEPALSAEAVAALREALGESCLIQLELDLDQPNAVEAALPLLEVARPDACLLPFAQLFPRDGDEADEDKARDLLDGCEDLKIGVQFAMSDHTDIDWFYAFRQYGVIPEEQHALLFILGEDGEEPQSNPHALRKYLAALEKQHLLDAVRWSVAAYGLQEKAALSAAIALGGQIAPGWAYNIHSVEGEVFSSQQQQVEALGQIGRALGRPLASAFEARTLLFGPR